MATTRPHGFHLRSAHGVLGVALALALQLTPVAAQADCDVHGAIDSLLNNGQVPANSVVNVRGWAVDLNARQGTGVSGVRVSLDVAPEQATGFETPPYGTQPRSEIGALYGDARFSPSDFIFVWDTGGVPLGRHTLYFQMNTACGWRTLELFVSVTSGSATGVVPGSATTMPAYQRGLDALWRQDYPTAEAAFGEVVQAQPDNAFTYVRRGTARTGLDDRQGAIADYDQAIQLDPNHPLPYRNRGLARAGLSDWQGAIADYDQAIRLDPNYAQAYFGRGFARLTLRDWQGAMADNDQVIRLDPDNGLAYNNRGFARTRLSDQQGAIADFDQAIRLDPNNAVAYYNRGLLRVAVNDREDARADFTRAAELFQAQGDPDRAHTAREQLSKLTP